ncbi:hypothetical protein ACQPYK_24440 [Streptosporangium sp. CA-135522]|uniref:hypothetical protein n=1 Tax=Streptosporangium sp. CA-135522 TaxID=3240072 RepID=UPI003D8E1C11
MTCPDAQIGEVKAGQDWSAVRLCLLGAQRDEPVVVDDERITSSVHKLARWRKQVAMWANCPSSPVSAEYVNRFGQALGDCLDTPRVVGVLDQLMEDTNLPDGARFESALLLDRVLALELSRHVGR